MSKQASCTDCNYYCDAPDIQGICLYDMDCQSADGLEAEFGQDNGFTPMTDCGSSSGVCYDGCCNTDSMYSRYSSSQGQCLAWTWNTNDKHQCSGGKTFID